MGAMRMPAIAATAALIIQLAAATRSGAMRLTSAPFAVSAFTVSIRSSTWPLAVEFMSLDASFRHPLIYLPV